ncbi:MAG: glycosyltransferase family 4 protein [Promethearchaeota archaeon]|nr:MAG: glycosyltransferase [Helarchaeota virus Nidhogg Meg22_1012]URC17399.1 MAG: glycosyltransferase [Helarchaeota virus Nidhogg Meg22_1214]
MKRILFCSDSPLVNSGFGHQLHGILTGLKQLYPGAYDLHCIGWQYVGRRLNVDGYTLWSRSAMGFGVDVTSDYLNILKPDILFTLGDLWMIEWLTNVDRDCPWVAYYPLDGTPLPKRWVEIIKKMDYPVVFSKFALNLCRKAGLRPYYIPHHVDTSVFFRLPDETRSKLKEKYGIPPDKKVILTVARPNPRKKLHLACRALDLLYKKRQDWVWYYHGDMAHDKMLSKGTFKDELEYSLFYKNGAFKRSHFNYFMGVSDAHLNEIYNMADVYFMPTGGEGFGLTVLEAGMTGLPSVLTDYTTSRELIEGRGELINVRSYSPDGNSEGVLKANIDIYDAVEKLDTMLSNDDLRKEYGYKCQEEFIKYEKMLIMPMWHELFSKINYNLVAPEWQE